MTSILHISQCEHLYRRLPELGFDESSAFLTQLARDPEFILTQILPSLSRAPSGATPTIAATYRLREASPCLQVFVWPAGAATSIHDHTSWGAYHCVVGTLLEERYERLDSGAQPSTARLRKVWRRALRNDGGASTVGAYEAGIHRISNPSGQPAISVHLYGPRVGVFDGRDYDPKREFVCDRLEVDELRPHPNHVARRSTMGTLISFCWFTRQPGLRGLRPRTVSYLLLVFASRAGKNEQQKECSWRASPSKPPYWEFASSITNLGFNAAVGRT
jgi:predicted metal-dependent enzyme (double-stranded beta helix superfamily)